MSLIAVMWIVAILTVLASEFMYSMQLEMRIARNWKDQMSAHYAAKGGLENAIIILKQDEEIPPETGAYDALDEDWAQELTGELGELIGSDYQSTYQSTYQTTVTDESAKINVNTTDEETLTKAIIYCMGSSDDQMEEEVSAQAQMLAAAVIGKRPFRTVAEMAKATDMTPELLYGESAVASVASDSIEEYDEEEVQSTPLVNITTIHSAEKNVASDGQTRVNINSADSNQIEQLNREGEQIITGEEAGAIVEYRDQQGNDQSNQGQPGQGQPGQGGSPGGGGQSNQGSYEGIGQLLEVPAISQEEFDAMSGRIAVEDEGGGEEEEPKVNINAAGAGELQNLEGVDEGIAQSIIRYREQKQFDNIEEIREVKAVSVEDMKSIVDRVTTSDDEALPGKVNINTAPLEILTMLPGMDEEKAQAIVNYRTVVEGQTATITASQQGNQEAGPFTSIGQLMDIEGIDENTFKSLIDHVSCRSAVFMIESEGRSLDGKVIQSCTAIIDRSGDRIETRYWKQE